MNPEIISITSSTIVIEGRRSVIIYGLGIDGKIYEYSFEKNSWN